MSLTIGLQAALTGLKTAQIGLDTTSHNIANVNTEGYSRKVFTQETLVVDGLGQGAQAADFRRTVNEGMQKDLQGNTSLLNELAAKESFMSRLQSLFGSPEDNTSISHTINQIQIAFEAYALDTSKIANQSNCITETQNSIDQMQGMSEYIQQLRAEVDAQIVSDLETIESSLESIDTYNQEIVRLSNMNQIGADDLKDKRDQALLEISALIDVTSFTRANGEIVVMTPSGKSLLDKETLDFSHTQMATATAYLNYSGGNISGIYAGDEDITESIESGRIGGLIELRDEILPNLQAELDELSEKMMQQMNSIHNRGTSFPDYAYQMEGNRKLVGTAAGPDLQQMTISDGDVRITIFDSDGKEVARTSLVGDLGFVGPEAIYDNSTHIAAVAGGAPNTLCSRIEDWLKNDPTGPGLANASCIVNSDGMLEIDTGNSGFGIGFRDEATSALGSTAQDATIAFDADGDGTTDETVEGFSYFFGLNDFLTSDNNKWMHDTAVISSGYDTNNAVAATINFSDANHGLNFGSITIQPNSTLQQVADAINEEPALQDIVSATVIKEGAGYRLRIVHEEQAHLEITEPTGTGMLSDMGLGSSAAGLSTALSVRDDLVASPSRISGAAIQYDGASGEYYISKGDNSLANDMAEMFTQNVDFNQAGYLGNGTQTLTEYATSFLSHTATITSNAESQHSYQLELTNSLAEKTKNESGVNLDEELASLMVYEQAYSAAAKIISATQEMLQVLLNII